MNTMKKNVQKVIVSLLTIFLILQILPINSVKANEQVFSESLELAIKEVLNIDKIDEDVIEETTELDLSNKSITDLNGIERFNKLESLNLDNNKIRDIKQLNALENLVDLSIQNQQIDITPVLESGVYILSDLIKDSSGNPIIPMNISKDGIFDGEKIIWEQGEQGDVLSYEFCEELNTLKANPTVYTGTAIFVSKEEFGLKEEMEKPQTFGGPTTFGIHFDDTNLIMAVNEVLGKGQGVTTEPTPTEMIAYTGDLDLSNKGIKDLRGLHNFINVKKIDLSNNLIEDGSLTQLPKNKLEELVLLDSFDDGERILHIQNFSKLKKIEFTSTKANAKFSTLQFNNLPELEELVIDSGKISQNKSNLGGGTPSPLHNLTIENNPKLRVIDFTSSATNMEDGWSPNSISLRNLPMLDLKLKSILSSDSDVVWFGGINPVGQASLRFIDIPFTDTISISKPPLNMVDAGIANPRYYDEDPFNIGKMTITLNNVRGLKTADLNGKLITKKIGSASFGPMPDLETVDLRYNYLVNAPFPTYSANFPKLEEFDFSHNNTQDALTKVASGVTNMRNLGQNQLLIIKANDNKTLGTTAQWNSILGLNDLTFELEEQRLNGDTTKSIPIDIFGKAHIDWKAAPYPLNLPTAMTYDTQTTSPLFNVAQTSGVYTYDEFAYGDYVSPLTAPFYASSHYLDAPTNVEVNYSVVRNSPVTYALEDFTSSLSVDKTSAAANETLEYTLTFKANGDTPGEDLQGVEIELPIPTHTTFVPGSVVIPTLETPVWDSVAKKNNIVMDHVLVGSEYTIKYKVTVDDPIGGNKVTPSAKIGKGSYAELDVVGQETNLIPPGMIAETHIDRLGRQVYAPTNASIPVGGTYTGVEQTSNINYVYIGTTRFSIS